MAESAKVNLRTIQRIENNESEPRGKTLNLICEVLNINAEDILDYGKKADKSYLIIFHLSVITFLAIPVGNIILPLILWMNKKDKIVGLKEVLHDWYLGKGNPEWWDFIASAIPILATLITYFL